MAADLFGKTLKDNIYMEDNNLDKKTVESFGDEWSRFDQSGMSELESEKVFNEYFSIFPWDSLPKNAVGFDMGCGTGRWALFSAQKVGHLNCIDPSSALGIAEEKLRAYENVTFLNGSVNDPGLEANSQDFGYSLGVLHHVPNTALAIQSCVNLLKDNAPLLLYLYYSFDNRPLWFRCLWKISDIIRKLIYRLPPKLKHFVTDIIAVFIYFPLAKTSLFLQMFKLDVAKIPLSFYKDHSFYTMRTDARDRFGTPLEQRFSQIQIKEMMSEAGLYNIKFSERAPFWCAMGIKKNSADS
jgi:ubiquinone/menaquinone biosynthesis C-methylase UbiE|tara:strand:- start:3558 stop:4448 length:891 start_codon:yes stop_codon:yes gene_type:complete